MIKVHKYGPAFGLPDASPFVTKVETYLRLTGQKYEAVSSDVRKSPRSQLPYADIDGKIVTDSSNIIDTLEAARDAKLDARLDAKEQAIAWAFKAMLEEHFYFGMLFMRWATDEGWAVFEPSVRDILARMGVPSLMRGMITKKARQYTVGRTRTQGIGRKPRAEVVAGCKHDLDALAVELGEKTYFCGDTPTTYDATVYAFVVGALCPAFDNEVTRYAAGKPNLVAYAAHIKEKYWQD
jgi:glutathione S-transferase